MTQNQLNLISMFRAVLGVLEGRPTLWSALSPLVECVEKLRQILAAIAEQEQLQFALDSKGVTADKSAQREHMCALAHRLVLKARPYARRMGDNEFLNAVDYSPSELLRASESLSIKRCETIRTRIAERMADLTAYNVTQAEVDALAAAIAAYRPLGAGRDVRRSNRKAATETLPLLIDEAQGEIDLLDDLVPGLIDDADFTKAYRAARRITNRRSRGPRVPEGGTPTPPAAVSETP